MNKTMKVALCIGLAGLGVLVWTHSATAAKPPSAPVVVTFLSGDVSAAPQALHGPLTATIDFAKFIPYICPISPLGIEGGTALLNKLASKNPITYSSLTITLGTIEPCYLGFRTTVDGVAYIVAFNNFKGGTGLTSTPTLDIFDYSQGAFAVTDSKGRVLVIASKCVGGVNPASVNFTRTK
jgi:hypothetical protein